MKTPLLRILAAFAAFFLFVGACTPSAPVLDVDAGVAAPAPRPVDEPSVLIDADGVAHTDAEPDVAIALLDAAAEAGAIQVAPGALLVCDAGHKLGSSVATDFYFPGQAIGTTLQFSGTRWQVLPPGTAGQFLQTGGAGALASWATVSSSGVTWANDLAGSTNTSQIISSIGGTGSPSSIQVNTLGLNFTGASSPAFTQSQLGGTGANTGATWQITAQQGQNQTGAVANNRGGHVLIASGQPGTGGSGAAGANGSVIVALGGALGTQVATFAPSSISIGQNAVSTVNINPSTSLGLVVGSTTIANLAAGSGDYLAIGSSPPASGGLRIGSVGANNGLRIDSAASPTNSQVRITSGGAGGFGFLAYAADNNAQSFDADYASNWIARSTSAAWFYKIANALQIQGVTGATIGNAVTPVTLINIALDTGAMTWGAGQTPTLSQTTTTTASATGATFTVQAQSASGTTSTGGDLLLSPGTGTSANGNINLNNLSTTTTAPAAGGAGALPATPAGYVTIKINGVARKLPYYSVVPSFAGVRAAGRGAPLVLAIGALALLRRRRAANDNADRDARAA